jgi:hypothetical protein
VQTPIVVGDDLHISTVGIDDEDEVRQGIEQCADVSLRLSGRVGAWLGTRGEETC